MRPRLMKQKEIDKYQKLVTVAAGKPGRKSAVWDKAFKMMFKHEWYTVQDGNELYTNSWQGKGYYMFTDEERAYKFISEETNFSGYPQAVRCSPLRLWERAMDARLDLLINPTPRGDKGVFMVYRDINESWTFAAKMSREERFAKFGK